MAERFFSRVANEVLEASEKLSARLEDGLAAVMTGEVPKPDDATPLSGEAILNGEQFLEEELQESPLKGITEGVLGDIFSSQVGPQTAWEHFEAFRHAITWSEPFILGLLAFHLVMFLICLRVSRQDVGIAPRLMVMCLLAGLVRSAELLNDQAAQNWDKIATQNYFDQRGIFVSVMVCGPLLVDSLMMLLLFVREAAQLLVQVKTAELKKKKHQQAKAAAADEKASRRSKKEQ